jgi:glutamate-1-semialdehyde 2,1-aminomutase
MQRFNEQHPADLCFARGTFNAHPHVMGAMLSFLERLETPEVQAIYADLDNTWNRRAQELNDRLRQAGAPVRVTNLSTVWTVLYDSPSRYNWMFQFYLRAEGLLLSWVGSGRLIFSLNYHDTDFEEVAERFPNARTVLLSSDLIPGLVEMREIIRKIEDGEADGTEIKVLVIRV